MTRSRARSAVAPVIALTILVAGCDGDDRPASRDAIAQPATTDGAPPVGIPRRAVTLLLPSGGAEGLKPVEAQIFATASPIDQAKQVVGLLLEAPRIDGHVAPFPVGTTLRAIFIDPRGTAFVSLSREATARATGGSAWEILAVNSLVGSLARSVPQVKRVQILVEGLEIETLAGHLDLRRPVTFDASLVLSK